MKIATWNLKRPERPKTSSPKNDAITEKLKDVDADIFVLTETNECIDLGTEFEKFSSEEVKFCLKSNYTRDDRRTTVWVKKKYSATREVVSDSETSVCVKVNTEQGELLVYGTVIGVLGHPSQNVDDQINDWQRASQSGKKSICIAGDFNIQFGRPSNFTDRSRDKIIECFATLGITNLTRGIDENIDHIAISNQFLAKAPHSETHLWNLEKLERPVLKLSDHLGVSVWLNI